MKRLGLGLILGLALGACGAALAHDFALGGGDHFQTGWSVLARGVWICDDPYIRPSEREIDCRTALSR